MVAPSRTLKYPESEIGDFSFSSLIGSGMKIRILKLTLFCGDVNWQIMRIH